MWPIFALAAVVLAACGSDSPEKHEAPSPPPPENSSDTDAGAPAPSESASAAPSPSASTPPPTSSSAAPDPDFPPLAPDAPAFPRCEIKPDEQWKSSFTTTFLDEAKFKQMISGGASFCVREPIGLSSGKCQDSFKFFPLTKDPLSKDRRMFRFNLESVLGSGEKCPSLFTIKEIDCHPTLELKDLLTCDEKPMLAQPLLLGTRVALGNLLQGDGNGDGQPDLLVQLSNGTGIYFSQIPTCAPNCGGGEELPSYQPGE